MSLKINICIGGLLVVIAVLISLVTFHFSFGPCTSGSFACDNGTKCIPQRAVCNKFSDCMDGHDEDRAQCGIFAGSEVMIKSILAKAITMNAKMNSTLRFASPDECILNEYPLESCTCVYRTMLHCRNGNLTKFIQPLRNDVTFLYLGYNRIDRLTETNVFAPELNYLNLRSNNISQINWRFFFGMPKLKKLHLNDNRLISIPPGLFNNLTSLEWLFLDSNKLSELSLSELRGLNSLVWLNLSNNFLVLRQERFPPLLDLYELLLQYNRIEMIDEFLFANLKNLHLLSLNNNFISYVHPLAFAELTELKDLRLSENYLITLPDCVFCYTSLDALHLGYNNIYVTEAVLRNVNLTYLNLDGIEYHQINFQILMSMKSLEIITYREFYYCTITPHIRNCSPKTDGISTVDDLLSKPVLRYSTWIMAVVTCAGNALVLWGRSTLRDDNRTVSMVIRNLAVADLLMGFYLIIIGIQDYRYRKIYSEIYHEWISSWTCIITGVLAMISSEVSMLIMTFMSIERFILIANPFSGHQKLNAPNVFVTLFTIWVVGMTIAVVPVILWRSSTYFYGSSSGMCFPLHLLERFPLGWQYSAIVFIGLNTILLLTIAVLYSALLVSILKTRRATPLSFSDCEFAIRFFFIVLTDASCWIPIIIYKILAFMSYRISGDVYAWLVVFILPLNSAINPLLYTFTTPKYRDRFFCSNWYRIKWQRRRLDGSAGGTGSSNQDDSQGKIVPLLYIAGPGDVAGGEGGGTGNPITNGTSKSWKF